MRITLRNAKPRDVLSAALTARLLVTLEHRSLREAECQADEDRGYRAREGSVRSDDFKVAL